MSTTLSEDSTVELSPDDIALTEVGILVVDEDPAFQLGLKTFLKEYVGFENVFTARNGNEAIDLIEDEDTIELLTLDYQMPGMDGIELLKHLREDAPRPLGVVMITGFPSEELKKNYANCTTSTLLTKHFLSKPVEFEKLEPIILDCYEELKKAQQLTQTMTSEPEEQEPEEINAMALAATNRELLAKFDLLEEKLEANTRALREMSKSNGCVSFVGDIVKLLVAAGLIFWAWNAGLVEKVKAWSSELLSKPAPAKVESKETASEESKPEAEPAPTPKAEPAPTPEPVPAPKEENAPPPAVEEPKKEPAVTPEPPVEEEPSAPPKPKPVPPEAIEEAIKPPRRVVDLPDAEPLPDTVEEAEAAENGQ